MRTRGTSLLAAVLLALSGCGETSPLEARLADIASRTTDEHPILGDAALREARRDLEALPDTATDQERATRLLQVGNLQTKMGELEAGIDTLDEAWRRVRGRPDTDDLRTRVAYRLGVAHARLGETRNCCARNTPESCILPIRGGGLHTDTDGSEQAMEFFAEVMEGAGPNTRLHLKARWLMNVAAMTLDRHPEGLPAEAAIAPETFSSTVPFPRFTNVAAAVGLDTFDLAGGAVVDDLDGDGDMDVMTSTYDPREPVRLFLREDGGGFTEAGARSGLARTLGGFNLVPADADDDGDLDVLVLRGAWLGAAGRVPNSLLINDGSGHFLDRAQQTGLALAGDDQPTQTGAWADYDGDGDLDLYVGNETPPGAASRGRPVRSQLFRNQLRETGALAFEDVAAAAGVTNDRYAKSVTWGDYDADGHPDLYVSNLGAPNRLYHNRGDGTFEDVATTAGVTGPVMSFASWFWDVDDDGALDLFVAAYDWSRGGLASYVADALGRPPSFETAKLYRGDGRGGFRDVSAAWGLDRIVLPMGASFGDLDNDGWLDLYLGTGYPDYEALMPNVMLRNDAGHRFVDVTYAGGFGHLQKGHAVAFADIDDDGDQDVFEQIGGFYEGDRYANALFENPLAEDPDRGRDGHWIAVELTGRRSNRSALGARVTLHLPDGRRRHRTVGTGGSFGAGPRRLHVGLGDAEAVEILEVSWPGGGPPERWTNLPAQRLVRLTEGVEDAEIVALTPRPLPRP